MISLIKSLVAKLIVASVLASMIFCVHAVEDGTNFSDGALQEAVKNARARQDRAEQALATTRTAIIKKRTAMMAALQRVQQQAHAHHQTVDISTAALQRLQELRQQAILQQNQQAGAYRLRIDSASAALGIRSPGVATPQELDVLFAEAVHKNIQDLQQLSHIRIEQTAIAQRNGSSYRAEVIYFGGAQQMAVAHDLDASSAENSGLLLPSEGGFIINGPRFNEQERKIVHGFVNQGHGYILADIDGALVTQNIRPWELGKWLGTGGFFVWPILAVALAALFLAIERFVVLRSLRISPYICDDCIQAVDAGDYTSAESLVADKASPLKRVLACALAVRQLKSEQRESHMEAALLSEEPLLERNRSLLAVLAAVAPLLGLLGTVTGMIGTFHSISVYGTGNPSLLSDGISEALITTQLGLMVAVPILLTHGIISRMIELRQTILEHSALQIMAHMECAVQTPETTPKNADQNQDV